MDFILCDISFRCGIVKHALVSVVHIPSHVSRVQHV
jgi:hypothetical protein